MTSLTFSPTLSLARPHVQSRASCGTRGCSCCATTSFATLPNALTIARTLVCAAAAVAGVGGASWALVLIAVAAYWVGDVADGILARVTGRETRLGAALDIVCDRACCAFVLLGVVALDPSSALPVAAYLTTFIVVDTLLS